MGDFCRCIESDPNSLRGEWERQLYLHFWRFRGDAEEIERANKYFREAERLRENAKESQAVIVCREFLWQEMQNSRRGSNPKLAVFLMRCALMQILRIYSANLDPVATNYSRNSLRSYISFLDWIIRPELESEDTESLRTCRVIICFELSCGHTNWERDVGFLLLNQLEKRFGADHTETRLLVQYLAESYVYIGGFRMLPLQDGIISVPTEAESILIRHLLNLEKFHDNHDQSCYFYALGRFRLGQGKKEEANGLFRRAFDERPKAFGDIYVKLPDFRDDLLNAYCARELGKPIPRPRVDEPHALVGDLVAFCLENENCIEAEILVNECLQLGGIFKKTSARNPPFYFDERSIQYKLASYKTPGKYVYWEDSWTYLRRWAEVKLIPAFPEDFFPRAPAKIVITADKMNLELSPNCIKDTQMILGQNSEANCVEELQNTVVWQYLESKRSRAGLKSWLSSYNRYQHRQNLSEPYIFWIFPDEHLRETSVERAALALTTPNWWSPLPRFTINLHLDTHTLPESEYLIRSPPEVCWYDVHIWSAQPLYEMHKEDSAEAQMRCSNIKEGMRYSIENIDEQNIHVTVPYVPYEHFQNTRAYRDGFTYTEYIRVLQRITNGRPFLTDIKQRLCKRTVQRQISNLWNLPLRAGSIPESDIGKKLSDHHIPFCGFFNGIPCGAAILDSENAAGGFNLLSSNWPDWRTFTLYETEPDMAPRLVLPTGDEVHCHGYITGSLWKDDLCQRWTGLRVFVVDAVFGFHGCTESHNFVFSSDSLTDVNVRRVSSFERRFFCGEICPALFYLSPQSSIPRGSFWKRSQKTKKQDTTTAEKFWEEMNRRETWDRVFEKRLKHHMAEPRRDPEDSEAIEALNAEKQAQQQRRRHWDVVHIK